MAITDSVIQMLHGESFQQEDLVRAIWTFVATIPAQLYTAYRCLRWGWCRWTTFLKDRLDKRLAVKKAAEDELSSKIRAAIQHTMAALNLQPGIPATQIDNISCYICDTCGRYDYVPFTSHLNTKSGDLCPCNKPRIQRVPINEVA